MSLGVTAAQAFATNSSGDANELSCIGETEASPGFRAFLPDCRAYELMGPPYKEGTEQVSEEAVSEDGSHVIFVALGAFAGSDGTSSIVSPHIYETSRKGDVGWVTESLAPVTAEFPGSDFIPGAASADLGKTLWVLHTPVQSVFTNDFYVRGPDGSFTEIGPGLPEAVTAGPKGPEILNPPGGSPQYAGASEDLTHVLFTLGGQAINNKWPGDTSVGKSVSLYEYAGTKNREPILVGVRNSGVLDGSPHLNEGAELISQCGTLLGSQHSVYNAVSETGERVFFTPQSKDTENCGGVQPSVQELYVRENEANTTLISGRSLFPEECSGACMTSTPRDANFEGASRNGSKVFFTSTQQLLNSATGDSSSGDSAFAETGCSNVTGEGGCNLYEYDFNRPAGHNLVLVAPGSTTPGIEGVQGVARISEDGSHVYFVAKNVLTGAEENSNKEVASPNAENLYVFEPDVEGEPDGGYKTVFIAKLQSPAKESECEEIEENESEEAGEICRERRREDEADWRHSDERPVQTTPEGRFIVFPNRAHLTADDTSREADGEPLRQLFEYDSQTKTMARISIGQRAPGGYSCPATKAVEAGYNCDGNVETEETTPTFTQSENLPGYFMGRPPSDIEESRSLLVSRDGSRVIFRSSAGLAPGSVNSEAGCTSAYEYESTVGHGGSIAEGNVYLISDGKEIARYGGGCGSKSSTIDASGKDVFIQTADREVPQDIDTQWDFYDVRADGGFPSPISSEGCEGDACQSMLSLEPALPIGGSMMQSGGGNISPPPPPPPRKSLTRAQKLAKALKACGKDKSRKKRQVCRDQAKKHYASKAAIAAGEKSTGRGGR